MAAVAAPTGPGPRDSAGAPGDSRARWSCALVNNMPDGAFEETERQFSGLLHAGAGGRTVEVRRFTLPGVPRGERTAERVAGVYAPLDSLFADPPDLLVVSGANPLATRIEDEPFWADLVGLLRWGSEAVPSMLLSCLAAHAGLAVFDGIERGRLDAKCTGVFPQRADPDHPLVAGIGTGSVLPHSRVNSVPATSLEEAGYRIALRTDRQAWSVATRQVGRSSVVLVQGHPEYGRDSLLREYHRDARRFVLGEREEVPCLPERCVAPGDWIRLLALQQRFVEGRRDGAAFDAFPFDQIGARATWGWRKMATVLYANWMAGVPARSS